MVPRTQVQLAYQLIRIRLFDERALEEFSRGTLSSTTHTCIGQEADAVGVIGALERSGIVFSNHRGHGHYLAHGGDMRALAAELMGRRTGVCGGIGGSQHLHFENDCVIGEYVHLAPGALLAGHVKVGTGALVGMGVTTHRNVTIGEWTRVGNGARIHGDVPPHTVVQAGTSWPV